MGIYLETQDHLLQSVLPLIVGKTYIESETGFMYMLEKNPLGVLESLYQLRYEQVDEPLEDKMFQHLLKKVVKEPWIKVKDDVTHCLGRFLNQSQLENLVMLGDISYDRKAYGKSQSYYLKALELLKAHPESTDIRDSIEPNQSAGSRDSNDHQIRRKAMCNLALLEVILGNPLGGYQALESLYQQSDSVEVLTKLVKVAYIYHIKNLDELSEYIHIILQKEPNEVIVTFLMWYYFETDDDESFVTCFNQVEHIKSKVPYIGRYMEYMKENGLEAKVYEFLEPIAKRYPIEYHIMYGKTLAENSVEYWKDILQQTSVISEDYYPLALNIAKALVESKQIIASLEFTNQIDMLRLPEVLHDEFEFHLLTLAQVSGSHSREMDICQNILKRWRKEQRDQYTNTFKNNWKELG
jgi:hypothetical protein